MFAAEKILQIYKNEIYLFKLFDGSSESHDLKASACNHSNNHMHLEIAHLNSGFAAILICSNWCS